MVPEEGIEPTRSEAPEDFESSASASSATPAPKVRLPGLRPARNLTSIFD